MNVRKVLAELRAERARIEEAIQTLERLAPPRRGRPPGKRPPLEEEAPRGIKNTSRPGKMQVN